MTNEYNNIYHPNYQLFLYCHLYLIKNMRMLDKHIIHIVMKKKSDIPINAPGMLYSNEISFMIL